MFQEQAIQSIQEENQLQNFSKIPLNTSISTLSPYSPISNEISIFPSAKWDNSFDQQILNQNIDQLQKSALEYLHKCLLDAPIIGFKDQNLYNFIQQVKIEQSSLEDLIQKNKLLSKQQKIQFAKIVINVEEIAPLLKRVYGIFGNQAGQQIFFLIFYILRANLQQFKSLKQSKYFFIEKYPCFYGYQDIETPVKSSCSLLQNVSEDEIVHFSSLKTAEHAKSIYFSSKLRYLNLRQTKGKLINENNIYEHFYQFLQCLIRTIFLTMSQMILFPQINTQQIMLIEEECIITEGEAQKSLKRQSPYKEKFEVQSQKPCKKQKYQ